MDSITRKVYVYHSMPSCSANRISASGRLVVSRAAFPLCRCSWDVYFAVNCLQLGFCCQWMGGNTIALLIILSSIAAVSWCHQPISGWLQVGRQWSAIGTKVSPAETLSLVFSCCILLCCPDHDRVRTSRLYCFLDQIFVAVSHT